MILAVETSCDETAAAVIGDGPKVLSNVLSSQMKVHVATGGIVPEVASRLQLEMIIPIIDQAMQKANVTWSNIDRLAVTEGPGLNGPLLVGVETVKALAYARDLPVTPVNHLAGHLYACLRDATEFRFPYLGLIVSGGHTELVLMKGHHQFELIGETRDDAAGEAFDKVARLLGFPYPGGPEISKAAENGNPNAYDFPRAMLDQDNFDFSFSGLKSAVRREVETIDELDSQTIANLAASFQAAVIDALVAKTVRAAQHHKPAAVLLGGGVAANTELRTRLQAALDNEAFMLRITPKDLATDNAAMIGLAAYYSNKTISPFELSVDPSLSMAATF